MDRTQKEGLVLRMRDELQNAQTVIVTRQVGLTVSEVTALRRRMRESQAEFKVLKNTLARLAVKGTALEGITEMLQGPTALAYSSDPISAAKVAVKFANDNKKLVIVGGCMNGLVLSEDAVKALATLPSLDELRGKIIGVISAPATKLAILLKEPAARVARVLAAKGSE
ncbi:MAG: 50S ribosomal protein L10 [Alphaproteobacteria bacterium]|nr:50S ribosomal protein L10 [Alphaproteobacteria bacterium]